MLNKWYLLILFAHKAAYNFKSNFFFLLQKYYVFTGVWGKLKNIGVALAGVAKWIESWSANQRVTSLIPSLSICLGCRPAPSGGHVRGNHTLMFLPLPPLMSLSSSLSSPFSKNKK